ncbi:MAG: hypothetical protein M1816_002551 [Peltula sp. TS41687]|nr:MAG: hypothetical protein M1816_002551 [Peltula sp. TS41687]
MYFQDLPNELVLHVFQVCPSVPDVLNLASSCRHFRHVYQASQKLPILFRAAEADLGPLPDAIQLVTHNDAQPAHLHRHVPLSLALLKQLLSVGRVAKKWEALYPAKKWKTNYEDRRLLSSTERYLLRRAIYRLWLYGRAFHNRNHPRLTRLQRSVVLERAELLHNWPMAELAEMEDVRAVIREVVERHICPSNGTVQRKFRKRFPGGAEQQHQQLMFNIHLNYPPPPQTMMLFQQHFHATHHHVTTGNNKYFAKYMPTGQHEPGAEGWGDEIPHYYVVEDMLKLDPGQIMWLRENAPLKGQVEMFVRGLGEWFENNGETFGQTLDWVLRDRGTELQLMKQGIEREEMGIVCDED